MTHTARTARRRMVEMDGSDLHITTDTPPQVRVHGDLQRLQLPELHAVGHQAAGLQRAHRRAEEALRGDDGARLLVRHQGLARFRCNVFNQRGAVGAVYRLIPEKIRTFGELGLPAVLADARRAAARPGARHRPDRQRQVDDAGGDDRQDQHRAPRAHPHDRGSDRVHPPAQELPRQPARGPQRHRQLRATRCAPRCARIPDIVLIGEMRDLETVEAALKIAETGPPDVRHAAHELGGADDQPHHRHLSRRTSRRRSARSSRSCSRASSARRCCREPTARGASCSLEILVPTPAIRNLIRDDKIHQIYGAMQTGQEKLGHADGEPVAREPLP